MNDLNPIPYNRVSEVTAGDIIGNATQAGLNALLSTTGVGNVPIVGELAKKGSQRVAEEVNKRVNNAGKGKGGGGPSIIGSMKAPRNNNGGNSGSGAPVRRFEMSGEGGNKYPVGRLSFNPEPYSFTLSTGIVAPTYSPHYLEGSDELNTLYLSTGVITVDTNNFPLSDFVQTIIRQNFLNALQRAVNFSITLTSANLLSYFNTVASVLSTYFFYKSILAYNSDPLNRNQGMLNLRQLISADDLNNLYELERLLLGTPLPPNLVNLIWWLNGNYSTSNLPQVALVKIMPKNYTYSSVDARFVALNTSPLISAVTALQSVVSTSQLIARATNWIVPSLPAYTSSPVYDLNFLTFFANSASLFGTSASPKWAPAIGISTNTIIYSTHTNELDGAAFGLCSIYDTPNSRFLPSLWKPDAITHGTAVGATQSNRWYWGTTGGGTVGWVDAGNYDASQMPYTSPGGPWIYNNISLGSGSDGMHKYNTQPVLGVNVATITQAAIQLVEWLFSIDAIGYIKDNRIYQSKGNNTIGRRN